MVSKYKKSTKNPLNEYDSYVSRPRNKWGILLKKKFAEKLLALTNENQKSNTLKILEIGPGDGVIGSLCQTHKHIYIGIEQNENIAKHLSSKNLKIYHQSVPPLPDLDHLFDNCFLLHVIEHLESISKSAELLRRIGEVLKKDGKLVIVTPDYKVWKSNFFRVDSTHQTPFTFESLKSLLLKNGFEISYQASLYGNYSGKLFDWPLKLLTILLNGLLTLFSSSGKTTIFHRGLWTIIPSILVVANKNPVPK